jgi:hypothetical protein
MGDISRIQAVGEPCRRAVQSFCGKPKMASMTIRTVFATFALAGAVSASGQIYGTTPNGHPIAELAPSSVKAVVLYFVATDCPISNKTFPEMRRVRKEFAARGVAFWFVYPNEGESAAAVKQHQAEFDADGKALLDDRGALTRLSRARVTPEAVVLKRVGGRWMPVYEGRVDDRYVHLGQERPTILNHFAERVVDELLSGKPVEAATGTPVGCGIMRASEVATKR